MTNSRKVCHCLYSSSGSRADDQHGVSASSDELRTRRAFTLVEILVVLTIIAILASLSAWGVRKVITTQRLHNTENVMRTISKMLNEHWAYVVAEAKKDTGVDYSDTGPIGTIFGPDITRGERNKVIWIKMRLMEAFPMSYNEIADMGSSAPKLLPYFNNIIPPNARRYSPTYYKSLQNTLKSGLPNDNRKGATESAACLLMALSIPRNGVSLNADILGANSVADTDGDGVQELIDSWGNPFSFFRFPTDNDLLQQICPLPAVPGGKLDPTNRNSYADPLDPSGYLGQWAYVNPNGTPYWKYVLTYMKNVHGFTAASASRIACYTIPTIVCWGPDGDLNRVSPVTQNLAPYGLGLDANTFVYDPSKGFIRAMSNQPPTLQDPAYSQPGNPIYFKDEAADNIYSFQLR